MFDSTTPRDAAGAGAGRAQRPLLSARRPGVLVGGVLLAALVVGIAVRIHGARKKAPATGKLPPEVMVAPPVRCDVDVTIGFPVDIEPIEQASIASKQAGYLDKVLVDRGDHVKSGQLLAVVAPAELADEAEQGKAQVTQAEAQLALATQNAERGRALYARQLISDSDLDQLETALRAARATLTVAQQQSSAADVRVAQTALTAPFDGYVVDRLADPGTLLTGGPSAAPILTLARLDPVRVFLHVDEAHADRVRLGQKVTVSVDLLGGRTFSGTVQRFSPALDMATRTETVEVQIPNPGDPPALRPGMYGHASLVIDRLHGGLVLPADAVLVDGPDRWVYVVRQEKGGSFAHRADVEIGFDGGNEVEIARGLAPGDQVVVRGVDLVGDQAPVRPVPAPAAPSALCAPSGG